MLEKKRVQDGFNCLSRVEKKAMIDNLCGDNNKKRNNQGVYQLIVLNL